VPPADDAEASQYKALSQKLLSEKREAQQKASKLAKSLEVAEQRLSNLVDERGQLQAKYVSLLKQVKDSPLGPGVSKQFEELAKKYPNFEFDPVTGVSKFHSDILFDTGSAALKADSKPLLREFAAIMNNASAQPLNILIVGHTDDQPIARKSTSERHPTNWHLSTNRANAVALTLKDAGISESRMGVAGYSKHQPAASNQSEDGRQQNRRVEIFVLAPNALVAGWEQNQRI